MNPKAQTAVITARGLRCGYGGREILAADHLQLCRGQLTAIVGGNGSGKSTLLRTLAGLLPPRSGTIRYLGHRALPHGAERTRLLGVVLQTESPTSLTVRQVVQFGLGLDRAPDRLQQKRVEDLLDHLGLLALGARPCNGISGGEWRRTMLARAMVARPAALILDEPTNHLDPLHRSLLFATLAGLRSHASTFIATHDYDCASICDRVIVVAAGRIVADGAPHETLIPDVLRRALSIRLRAVADPLGGPPLLRFITPHPVDQRREPLWPNP